MNKTKFHAKKGKFTNIFAREAIYGELRSNRIKFKEYMIIFQFIYWSIISRR